MEAAVQARQAAVRVPRRQAHRRHGAEQGGEVQGPAAGAMRYMQPGKCAGQTKMRVVIEKKILCCG